MPQPTLLLIDVQCAFDDPFWGERNNPEAEKNIAKLLAHWRAAKMPLAHIRHCSTEAASPLREGQPGHAFKPEGMPLDDEKVFSKNVNSGFIGTGLEAWLRENEAVELVIVGLTTDHCVSTTVRMAGNLGFKVTLIADATATFDRKGIDGEKIPASLLHDVHLASLHGEFCRVQRCSEFLSS